MKLSAKSKYGLTACIELAACHGEGSVAVSQLSDRVGVSEKFLEQIMSVLRKEGVVVSTRGAMGGYALVNPPSKTTVGAILRALEDNLEIVECVGGGSCSKRCASFSVWEKLYTTVNEFLDSITLASLVK